MSSEVHHYESELAALRPGMRFDKYEIVEVIGTGGQSVVWRAVEQLLGRTVAIKELTAAAPLGDREAAEALRQRIEQEIELHRRLARNCPDLVQLYDSIVDDRGAFLIMEHVQGPSLAQVLAHLNKPAPPKRGAFVLHMIARAVAQLHAQGVVHRDLKPGNILLPDPGGVKLCDLGIAALIADQEALTLGSVRYMAPELCRGEAAEEHSDIYSLGMVAYEMLAGAEGFEHAFRTVLRDRNRQDMRWIKWHTNPRLAAPPLKQINPHVPSKLSALVARMMEKDPMQRISSAQELVAVLERNLGKGGKPLAAAGEGHALVQSRTVLHVSPEHATAELPQRRRWPLFVAAAVALLLLAGGGWLLNDIRQERQIAERQIADAQATFEQARADYQAGAYDQAGPLFAALFDEWTVESSIGRHAQAGLMLVDIQQYLQAGDYDEARELFSEVNAMALDSERIGRQELYELRGHIEGRRAFDRSVTAITEQARRGELGAARRELDALRSQPRSDEERRILDGLAERIGDGQRDYRAEMVLAQSAELVEGNDVGSAIDLLDEAQRQGPHPAMAARLAELREEQSFRQALQRAREARRENNLARAVNFYNQALRIRENRGVERERQRVQADQHFQRGEQLQQAGRLEEARQALDAAIELTNHGRARELAGELDGQIEWQRLVAAGDEATAENDHARAIEHYEQALTVATNVIVRHKLNEARHHHAIQQIEATLAAGELDAAADQIAALQREAIADRETRRQVDELGQRLTYWRAIHVGDEAAARENWRVALREYEQASRLFDDQAVRERITDASYAHLTRQARAQMAEGEWRFAEAILQAARNVRDDEQVRELLTEVRRKRSEADD